MNRNNMNLHLNQDQFKITNKWHKKCKFNNRKRNKLNLSCLNPSIKNLEIKFLFKIKG